MKTLLSKDILQAKLTPEYYQGSTPSSLDNYPGTNFEAKKTRLKWYFLFNSRYLRPKIRKHVDNVCFLCKKTKRLKESVCFFSSKNKSHFSVKANRWIIDYKDYRWVCRDCAEKAFEHFNVNKDQE